MTAISSITSNRYVQLMRIDHWIKQLFILPGAACGIFFINTDVLSLTTRVLIALLATSIIASANYVINEYLDAPTDKFHPTKKYRTAVMSSMDARVVWGLWGVLSVAGLATGLLVNVPFTVTLASLWIMGILYNVKPLRTKDITYLDVLSESVNNAIRLMLGWFVVIQTMLPPSSIIIGYWMAGAFLMATKRLAEYRMIGDARQAVTLSQVVCRLHGTDIALFGGVLCHDIGVLDRCFLDKISHRTYCFHSFSYFAILLLSLSGIS